MIDYKELRIGSITKQGIVHAITYNKGKFGCYLHSHPFDSSGGEWFDMSDIDPLPITEYESETLLKFGFKEGLRGNYLLECNGEMFRYWLNSYFPKERMLFVVGKMKIECDYIHTLQNIMFVLTGKEL